MSKSWTLGVARGVVIESISLSYRSAHPCPKKKIPPQRIRRVSFFFLCQFLSPPPSDFCWEKLRDFVLALRLQFCNRFYYSPHCGLYLSPASVSKIGRINFRTRPLSTPIQITHTQYTPTREKVYRRHRAFHQRQPKRSEFLGHITKQPWQDPTNPPPSAS